MSFTPARVSRRSVLRGGVLGGLAAGGLAGCSSAAADSITVFISSSASYPEQQRTWFARISEFTPAHRWSAGFSDLYVLDPGEPAAPDRGDRPGRPGLVVAGIFSFLLGWNEVLFSSVFTLPATRTVAVQLQVSGLSQEGGALPLYRQVMSSAVLCALPVVVLYLVFQRQLVAGLTSGGVK